MQQRGGSRRRASWLAVLVAPLCLIGQFSGIAHNLLVQHATCAEHGELVHTAGLQQTDGVGSAVPADAAVRGSAPGEAVEEHGHDHCLAVAHGRGHIGLQSAGAAVSLDATPPALGSVTDGDAVAVSVALYRLAPKNSPPA
jgi:hypothetical protein